MIGMAIAIVTTLAWHPPTSLGAWALVVVGFAIGGGTGAVIARRVPMTAMPELVAAFHSLVGMAAVLVAAAALYAPAAFGIGTAGHIHGASLVEMSLGVAIGAVTFTGSGRWRMTTPQRGADPGAYPRSSTAGHGSTSRCSSIAPDLHTPTGREARFCWRTGRIRSP